QFPTAFARGGVMRTLLAATGLLAVALAMAGLAMADREDDDEAYAIGLWGDLPYNDIQAITGVPNLIADMNSQNLKFTVHDGDLKAGNGTHGSVTHTICSDALYIKALGFFNALREPAMLTHGDSVCMTCDRHKNGGLNTIIR